MTKEGVRQRRHAPLSMLGQFASDGNLAPRRASNLMSYAAAEQFREPDTLPLLSSPSGRASTAPLKSGSSPGTPLAYQLSGSGKMSPPSAAKRPASQQVHGSPARGSTPMRKSTGKLTIGSRGKLMSGDSLDQAWTVTRNTDMPMSPDSDDDGDSCFRHDRGVYWSTKAENAKKGLLFARMDTSTSPTRGGSSPNHSEDAGPAVTSESMEQIHRAFKEEVAAVDKSIAELNKNLRMEHFSSDENDKDKMKRDREEAQRRLVEAELRKARLAEKDARDPHRKIQLRLENKRRFEMDTLDKCGIPMMNVESENAGGKASQIRLVDVQTLKCQCQGLAQGIHSVRELVVLQQRRERSANMSQSSAGTFVTLGSSFSMPSLDTLGLDFEFDTSLLPSQQSHEDRVQKAKLQRKVISSEGTVRRLNQMRTPPGHLPHSYDVFEFCGRETRGNWATTRFGIQRKPSVMPEEFGTRCRLMSTDSSGQPVQYEEVHTPGGSKQTVKIPERRKVRPEVVARVKQLWRAARGFARLLTVYFAHVRILNSHSTMNRFMVQLGEWSRIRNAMSRYVRIVKNMQRTARNFLLNRKARCEIMNKDFQRVEDAYLLNYHKLWAHKAVEQRAQGGACGMHPGYLAEQPMCRPGFHKQKTTHAVDSKKLQESDKFMEQVYDWKGLRIPPHVRKQLLIRYYMVILMKRLRYREHMLESMKIAVVNQKELVRFLKLFNDAIPHEPMPAMPGVSESQRASDSDMTCTEFWHLSEDVLTELVVIAAESLFKHADYPRFIEHPGNKSEWLPEEDYDKYCRPPRRISILDREPLVGELNGNPVSGLGLLRTRGLFVDKKQAQKSTANTPAAIANSRRRKSTGSDTLSVKMADADLDEVMERYTPRLKDIVQQQTSAWAASPQDPDKRLEPIDDLASQWDLRRQ